MEWAALALALVLTLGLGLARALRERHPPPDSVVPQRREADAPEFAPEDAAELERQLAAIAAEGAHTLESLLGLRLRILSSRHVPLRAVRAAPGPRTGRLVFADSTVLLARARRSGELFRLALAIRAPAVTTESWSHEQDGTVLTFTWPRERAELVLIGLDQAD